MEEKKMRLVAWMEEETLPDIAKQLEKYSVVVKAQNP